LKGIKLLTAQTPKRLKLRRTKSFKRVEILCGARPFKLEHQNGQTENNHVPKFSKPTSHEPLLVHPSPMARVYQNRPIS